MNHPYNDEQLVQFTEWAKNIAEGFPKLKDIYEPWKTLEQMLTDLQRYRAEEIAGPCKYDFKEGWYCSGGFGHAGPCALWPVSHSTYGTLDTKF
jgi:hypothetical protein